MRREETSRISGDEEQMGRAENRGGARMRRMGLTNLHQRFRATGPASRAVLKSAIMHDGKATEYTTDAVYGITRDIPLNYTPRNGVDHKLIENLTREKHVVIYGSSKQGKTCLRKYCLKDSDYITVQCASRWTIEEILSNILKRAGFMVTQSEKRTVSGKNKIIASIKASLFGVGSELSGEKETENSSEILKAELELDPSDVNDVIAALSNIKFDRYVVLEDFHYLPVETQKDFAVALKAFHEGSKICFVIIGVWLEENRLVVYNGDLTGRVVAINADQWSDSELQEVIGKGEKLLNIQFADEFKNVVVRESYGSVYVVQEASRQGCLLGGVTSTQAGTKQIGKDLNPTQIVRDVVNQQGARYMSFLSQFAGGFQETRLEMYKWLLYPVLAADPGKLEKGFKQAELRRALKERHPSGETLNPGNLTQALQSVASLQVAKDIKPIILDYDQTNLTLNVVDRGFVIWLNYQSKNMLFEDLGLPAPGSGTGLLFSSLDE
jgi:hypothetical protein